MIALKNQELEIIKEKLILLRNSNLNYNIKIQYFIFHWFYMLDAIFHHYENILHCGIKCNNIVELFNTVNNAKRVDNNSLRKFINKTIFTILSHLYSPISFAVCRSLVFPGVTLKLTSKRIVFNLLTFLQALCIEERPSLLLKKEFINYIDNTSLPELQKRLLINCIPESLFCNSSRLVNLNELLIYCSPQLFLQYNILTRFLLLENVKIVGLQHGCGYGIFKKFPSLDFELAISDKYYGWGLLDHNINQTRFTKANDSSGSLIYWIGRSQPSLLSQEIDGEDFYQITHNNTLSIVITSKILYHFNYIFLKHPSNSHPAYDSINLNHALNKINKPSEKLISVNDVVIFDTFSSTLIYFCLFNKIRFVIISDINLLNNITYKYKRFLDIRAANGQLIDTNQPFEHAIVMFSKFYHGETIVNWTLFDELFDFVHIKELN